LRTAGTTYRGRQAGYGLLVVVDDLGGERFFAGEVDIKDTEVAFGARGVEDAVGSPLVSALYEQGGQSEQLTVHQERRPSARHLPNERRRWSC
jgi:hypothetical protein